ncbi:MAG: hypothetical protein PVJ53_01715 [Desulfobacterales bacterium]|jgi:hypothetical protein
MTPDNAQTRNPAGPQLEGDLEEDEPEGRHQAAHRNLTLVPEQTSDHDGDGLVEWRADFPRDGHPARFYRRCALGFWLRRRPA